MANLKSLFAILTFASLLLIVVGLVRFGVDLWDYLHPTGAATSELDFRGFGVALAGAILAGFFILLFRLRKH